MLQDFVCGVYTRAARLNHSCRPNTRPIFRDSKQRKMSVIAIDDILIGQKNDGINSVDKRFFYHYEYNYKYEINEHMFHLGN